VDSSTGLVTTLRPFDFESSSVLLVTVTARNPGAEAFSTCQLEVRVAGQNEFAPKFTQPVFQFTVSESAKIGSAIGKEGHYIPLNYIIKLRMLPASYLKIGRKLKETKEPG
jgi:hypothetical protein